MKRNILCVDLKSFYASVECNERALNPFKTPLVVANKKQGGGAITLAVTPYLKSLGIKSRGRLFEIPKNIDYIIAAPRMSKYIEESKKVVSIYLDFVSKDDLHLYSIDEAFLDVTDYLKLYNESDVSLAKKILKEINKRCNLTATCGIGPNMFLAKVAMDTEAKKAKDNIAKWTYDDVRTKLWSITTLSDMWGIGYNLQKGLNNLGIFSVKDLALYDKHKLIDIYGVIGEELHNHANGYDESIIKEKYNIRKSISYSNGQILFKDYNKSSISLIISEILDTLILRLYKENKLCKVISLGIGYSKDVTGGFYHRVKLDNYTSDKDTLFRYAMILFERYYDNLPIRKVSISLGGITNKDAIQLNLFNDYSSTVKKDNINTTILDIKNKYGKNSILSATSLLSDSTIIDRNKKIGGHNA